MRLVIVLAVAAAVTVMIGLLLIAASVVMRLLTRHQPAHMARLGLDVVAAGIAFGLVVLVFFARARIGGSGRSRPRAGTADHRRGVVRPESAGQVRPPGEGMSSGEGRSPGHGKERGRAGAPSAGSGHAGRDGGARPGRPPVLNPTNVYSPGGLIDVPRDGRAPGPADGESIPEILRTAEPGPAPGARGGGWPQDRPSSAWAGPQPPRYQPGMNPDGPGRAPHPPGRQPVPPMPPRDQWRAREAPRPPHPMPGREGVPGREREPMPPRGAGPPQNRQAPREAPRPDHPGPLRDSGRLRDAGPPREGMPREGMGPSGLGRAGGSGRAASPPPPRGGAHQAPSGQGHRPGRDGGRHAGGPDFAGPGVRRPNAAGPAGPRGSAGTPGYPGPAEGAGQFDGGYAHVIRASDSPVRPSGPARPPSFGRPGDQARPKNQARPRDQARPGDQARSADHARPGSYGAAGSEPPADVYVYRDTNGQPGEPGTASREPDENDAAYWYDLPRTGDRADAAPRAVQEARGPFEPLVSSADPAGAPRSATFEGPGSAESAVPEGARPDGVPGDAQDTETAHARKLEQIKDLYLTAEAIGEANVDKHFDQLLAQQRELISDYFRQSATPRPAGPDGQAAGGDPSDAGYPAPGPASPYQVDTDQADTDPGIPRHPGLPTAGPAAAGEGARITADQPRAW